MVRKSKTDRLSCRQGHVCGVQVARWVHGPMTMSPSSLQPLSLCVESHCAPRIPSSERPPRPRPFSFQRVRVRILRLSHSLYDKPKAQCRQERESRKPRRKKSCNRFPKTATRKSKSSRLSCDAVALDARCIASGAVALAVTASSARLRREVSSAFTLTSKSSSHRCSDDPMLTTNPEKKNTKTANQLATKRKRTTTKQAMGRRLLLLVGQIFTYPNRGRHTNLESQHPRRRPRKPTNPSKSTTTKRKSRPTMLVMTTKRKL